MRHVAIFLGVFGLYVGTFDGLAAWGLFAAVVLAFAVSSIAADASYARRLRLDEFKTAYAAHVASVDALGPGRAITTETPLATLGDVVYQSAQRGLVKVSSMHPRWAERALAKLREQYGDEVSSTTLGLALAARATEEA